MSLNRIAMVLPYFGRLPSYFNFYLKSLEGKKLDVLLVSDLEVAVAPTNLKRVRMTLKEVESLGARKLAVKVVLNAPIRLCDFKPMYGHVFEDYLKEYDYWAFGDCDLVYGNALNQFLDRVLAEQWDAVSCRSCWSSGSFFLMKNTDRMRRFYQRCVNWKEIAALERNSFVNFDEIGSQKYYRQLRMGQMTMAEATKERDCLSAALWRADDIQFLHEDVACEDSLRQKKIRMESNGELSCNGVSIAYFHFIEAKWQRYFVCPFYPYSQIGDYWITETGIHLGAGAGGVYKLRSEWRKVSALARAAMRRIAK